MSFVKRWRKYTSKSTQNLFRITVAALCVIVVCSAAFFHLSFPVRYKKVVVSECEKYGLNPADIYAIIWAESKFDERAISSVGACGLMQLMPETASWCALNLQEKYAYDLLFDAEYNIKLGVFYYGYLLKKFGEKEKALAAYNAGEGNVYDWMAEKKYEIKFPETRRYVKIVNAISWIYGLKLTKN